jgi:hypothetical protein
MIHFHSKKYNTSVQITALGYQYTGQNEHHWDDNWLKMELLITQTGASYIRQDPFLLTWECHDLAEWFCNFPNRRVGEFYVNIENTLSFTKISNDPWNQSSNFMLQIHRSLIPEKLFSLSKEKINNENEMEAKLNEPFLIAGENDEVNFYFFFIRRMEIDFRWLGRDC